MKYLHRTERKKIIQTKYFVFDVETKGKRARPDAFIFGCIYGHNYREVFYTIEQFKELLKHRRFRNSYIFAHNAQFDLSCIFDNIIRNVDPRAVFNNRFISAKYINGITFADSFNVFPTSVKKIGEQIGLEKLEINEGFIDGTIREITHTEIEYCIRDCEIVYEALAQIFEICGSIKITLAGLALALYRNTYLPVVIKSDDNYIYDFFNSYYGGRVEAFVIGKTNAHKYDINSMYPFAMREAVFPNPLRLKELKGPSIKKFEYCLKRFEGMAEVEVYHQPGKVGYLPYKWKDKLCFPVGKFKGCWNFNELRYAIESGKVSVLSVARVVYGDRWKSPFVDFVNDIYAKRKASTGIYNTIYKLLLNSLYGKFAQRIRFDQEYFDEIPYDYLIKLHNEGKKVEIVNFSQKRDDCYIRVYKDKNLHHTIPLLSSYITSFARVELLKYMIKHEKDLAYVDTDSLCLTEEQPYNDLELGGLKKEKGIMKYIHGNKSYEEEVEKQTVIKLKGVPKSATKKNGVYTYEKMTGTIEALRRNKEAGVFLQVSKKLKLTYDKRIVNDDGSTIPITL